MCITLSIKVNSFFLSFWKKVHHKMKMFYASFKYSYIIYVFLTSLFCMYFLGIDWVQGNAECLPFEDNSFDAYTIAYGIRNCTHVDKVRFFQIGYQNLI